MSSAECYNVLSPFYQISRKLISKPFKIMQFCQSVLIQKHHRLKSTYFGEKSKFRFAHKTFYIENGIIFKTWRKNSFLDLDFIESNAMFYVLLGFLF